VEGSTGVGGGTDTVQELETIYGFIEDGSSQIILVLEN
jgi:hypothetical protein